MSSVTTKLGGAASSITVSKIGMGLMMMTWAPTQLSDETLFETIKTGVDALPPGVKLLINSGEFYANDFGTANLELLSRFFEKYPDYANKTFLSVKGGLVPGQLAVSSSPENLRRSIDNINKALRGTKRLDLFESARVDTAVPIEETMKTLSNLVKEGKCDYIGLSECNADTVRRAASVAPVAAVEIEISPLYYEEETKTVIDTCKELGIVVVGYSPIARGLLSATIQNVSDLPENDMRRRFHRFSDENLSHNAEIAGKLRDFGEKKGVSAAQISIAWVSALGPHVIPLPGSKDKNRNLENLKAGDVQLSAEEVEEIKSLVEGHGGVKGGRYYGGSREQEHLWG